MAGARLAGRGSRAGARRARAYTHSAGAGESGLARLVELHFVNLMGDAALTVSLAGTIFAIPTDEARGQVAQFLALTMAPFALLAPFIGPLLDRFRHGRRWAIGTTLALRAFLCWVLAGAVANDSPWLFPAALGCLVASKAYGVTRASAVPRLLPPGFSLVNANSRNALAGVAGHGRRGRAGRRGCHGRTRVVPAAGLPHLRRGHGAGDPAALAGRLQHRRAGHRGHRAAARPRRRRHASSGCSSGCGRGSRPCRSRC